MDILVVAAAIEARRGRAPTGALALMGLATNYDVDCPKAFCRLFDVKRDCLTLRKCFEAATCDLGVMHEYVVTVVTGDKAEAFGLVEPLHSSFCHARVPPFID
jgi:hypothetical protein